MSKAGSSLNTSSSITANNNSVRVGIAVQADWDNKQFSNALSLHVRRLFEFILQFEHQICCDLMETWIAKLLRKADW